MMKHFRTLHRVHRTLISQQCGQKTSRVASEPFLNGSSSSYIEEMYNSWYNDPSSVHKVSICDCLLDEKFLFEILLSIAFMYFEL